MEILKQISCNDRLPKDGDEHIFEWKKKGIDNERINTWIIELISENQGLKLAIEKGYGGNCIIAPKEVVDKIAKERYDRAINSIEGVTFDYHAEVVYTEDEMEKALKIAAGL